MYMVWEFGEGNGIKPHLLISAMNKQAPVGLKYINITVLVVAVGTITRENER